MHAAVSKRDMLVKATPGIQKERQVASEDEEFELAEKCE